MAARITCADRAKRRRRHRGNHRVGVGGEAASDPTLALGLVGRGITRFSMAPACIAEVRTALAERTLEECQALASAGRRRSGGRRDHSDVRQRASPRK